jgi:hypothetical protein
MSPPFETPLDRWIARATRDLSLDSAGQVRAEIQEHFESAREAAIAGGAGAPDADRMALGALGDPKTAHCQYRKVLLTSAEAKMLREGNWESRAVCARPWLKHLLLAVPAIPLIVTFVMISRGATAAARLPFLASVALFIFFAAPFLPVYTPWRARAYRAIKWATLVAIFALAFGADSLKYSWLIASCLWIPCWTEATRMSIRRKLPVAQWPKQLYL